VTLPLRALAAEEVNALRSSVRAVAQAGGGPAFVRSLENRRDDNAFDERTWTALARDVGLAGLGLPDGVGGIGGLVEVLAVAEELGAELCAVPFLSSTVLAGQVLLRCPDAAEALSAIAGGAIVSVAFVDAAGQPAADGVGVATDAGAGSVRLDGHARFVVDGMSAQLLVVSVTTPDGVDLALVDPLADGVTRAGLRVLDFSRPQADITFTATPAILLTSGGTGAAALRGGLDVALLALAAEQLGGAQRAFDRTLEYIKMRRQFNREIGSFQAVKHRMADALALVEQARSAIERVTWAELDDDALGEAAAVAKVWCSEAFTAVTAEMIQLHGGIGFTWEHDAQLYFRRAQADAVLWGDATYYRERIAQLRGW
jgi:alkylation response protein AidB-like acyl-CoA dehydrogenase